MFYSTIKQPLFRLLSLVIFLFSFPSSVFAQTTGTGLGCGEGFGLIAKALCSSKGTSAGENLNSVVSAIIGFMTVIAGIWFMFQIIIAGYDWISAGGDKTKTEAAMHRIRNALIGLVIVVAAWVIVGVFGTILGLDILNPGNVLQKLKLA